MIGATDQKLWGNLTTALGREDLCADERFARSRIREQHRDELEPIIEAVFAERDRDEWVALMQAHNVPVAPVNSFLELTDDPDVRANACFICARDNCAGCPCRRCRKPPV